jgi:hypothetical protein
MRSLPFVGNAVQNRLTVVDLLLQYPDVGGVKVASRDVAGPTTKLAVVAKAGTRYQSAPGLTSGLEQFAFKVGVIWSQMRLAA